jgi:hypothetical protein
MRFEVAKESLLSSDVVTTHRLRLAVGVSVRLDADLLSELEADVLRDDVLKNEEG